MLSLELLRRSFVCLALFVAAVATAVCDGAEPKRYGGYSLDEWNERIKAFPFDSPEAADSVPGLIEIVRDDAVPWMNRRNAALTLGRMGRPGAEAVPVLIELISQANPSNSDRELWVLAALARFGPMAAAATPAVVEILQDESRPHLNRLSAMEVLGRIGPANSQAVSTLMKWIDQDALGGTEVDRQTDLIVAAIDALSLSGAAASSSVPSLMRRLDSPSERIRRSAVVTLGAIGPAGEPAALRLAEICVRDPDLLTRDRAASALVGIQIEALMEKLLQAPTEETRTRMAVALGAGSGTLSPMISEALSQRVRNDESPAVRLAAITAIWKKTRSCDGLEGAAVTLLANPERTIQKSAFRLLIEFDRAIVSQRKELEKLAADNQSSAGRLAQSLLERLDRKPDDEATP
jgi:HEAT repeat protein